MQKGESTSFWLSFYLSIKKNNLSEIDTLWEEKDMVVCVITVTQLSCIYTLRWLDRTSWIRFDFASQVDMKIHIECWLEMVYIYVPLLDRHPLPKQLDLKSSYMEAYPTCLLGGMVGNIDVCWSTTKLWMVRLQPEEVGGAACTQEIVYTCSLSLLLPLEMKEINL